MGDPRKHRKKYSKPMHPWQRARIEEERELVKVYGVKNKKELWKISSKLKNFKEQAKKIIRTHSLQSQKEKEQLMNKLNKLGLLSTGATLDDVLGLSLKNVLDRRLQSILLKKGSARTIKQARQFITHQHIMVGGKMITSPNYLVSTEEESQISFASNSTLSNPEHPERVPLEKKSSKEKVENAEKTTETLIEKAKQAIPLEEKSGEKNE